MAILRLLAALATAALLAGCATSYTVESQVQSFSSLPSLASPPGYRFERLPSQQAAAGQSELEALADPALHKAGLRRDDAAPRYTVQVGARVARVLSPYADTWGGWGWGRPGRHWGLGFHRPLSPWESPWYQREVSVVVRELPANRVVYETRAETEGLWSDHRAVLTALFEAAMQGFPNPPSGPRRVDVLVGR